MPAASSTVNAGTVTFTVKNGTTVVGATTTSGTVSNGAASVSYALPVGLAAGNYTIEAVYNPSTNFAGSSATGASSKTLSVGQKATTTTVAASPNPVQYSDVTTLTATITPATAGGQNVAGSVQFRVNGTDVGTAPVSVTAGVATASYAYAVPLPAGTYPIGATFTSSNANFAGGNTASQSPAPTLTVQKETMTLEYTGQSFLSTSKAGSSISVPLSAKITEQQDGHLGPVSWSSIPLQVSFTVQNISGSPITTCTANATQTSAQVLAGIGTASCAPSQALSANNYVVQIQLLTDSYYSAEAQDVALTITDPGTGFSTGGGWILDPNTNARSNFGFTVKYLKNGSIQGNSLFIYRTQTDLGGLVTGAPYGLRDYNFIVKSNSMSSLFQQCSSSTGALPCWATFSGKSNVTAVDATTGLAYTLGSNLIGNQQSFQVDITDNGEPGSSASTTPDSYAIRVWTSTGTYYQVGTPASTSTSTGAYVPGTQIVLSGGNVQVHS